MRKSQRSTKPSRKSRAEELFIRADRRDEAGDYRSAFKLFLAGAKLGEGGCQLNVGNYYDDAKGVRRNRDAALYWYKRAYRKGIASAAHNIGILWRNERKHDRALQWFQKAVRMGDAEANLQIAKYYLLFGGESQKAVRHLERVRGSGTVTLAGREEAAKLLRRLTLARKRT